MRRIFAAAALFAVAAATPVSAQGWQPYGQMRVGMEDARDIAFEQGVVNADQVSNDGYRWYVRGRDVTGRWVQMTIDGSNGSILVMNRGGW